MVAAGFDEIRVRLAVGIWWRRVCVSESPQGACLLHPAFNFEGSTGPQTLEACVLRASPVPRVAAPGVPDRCVPASVVLTPPHEAPETPLMDDWPRMGMCPET
ncbi:Phospholipase Abhd3 [Manis pentadactyla]|nr:Phospholipase Abhd3 [Manis pentadactyla]